MKCLSSFARLSVVVALIVAALLPAGAPLRAQDGPVPIPLDAAGFGLAQMDALEPGAQAEFALELAAGDRVAMDLQGGSDAVVVSAFAAPWGDLAMEGVPEAFNYLAWAPEDGTYTVVVENTGDAAAGFVLRVVVSPAPLPADKVVTLDADGQSIPIALGETFQVALDAAGDADFPWQLGDYDTSIVSEAGGSAMVLLGTMPGAMRQEIFTFVGMAPGATTLAFTNEDAGENEPATFSATIDVMEAAEEPAPQALTLDASGVAQASGSLDPQGMASYVVDIDEGASVQALITPDDAGFVLTVVGADGNPLQTDHAGAGNFDQVMPVSQEYTFKVINFGDASQAYEFAVSVTQGESGASSAVTGDAALGQELVTAFFDTLQAGDADQVAALLAPDFQLLRSTGEVFDAASYPDVAPVYEAYVIDNLKITRAGDVLVATYTAQTDSTVDGTEAMGESAPRLTVFQQIDGEWKLAAHANFGPPPAAESAAATGAAPATAGVTVTESDNGGSVQVGAGGQLAVELPGNPTTGYVWQVANNDESILLPTAYEFTPSSDAAGAGGVEKFTFHVMAPGAVNLVLANSRPWETDTPPAETFTLAVDAVAAPAPDNAMITVGAADNGGAVTLLPGAVLLVSLDGAADGMWMLTQGEAMVAPPLGDWQAAPSAADPAQATFQRSFLGVGPGAADLQFEFMNADGSMGEDAFAITVEVLPQEPGSSGAVVVGEGDAGGAFDLVTGDTLVVRLPANPTTGYDWRVVSANDVLLPSAGDPTYAVSSDLTGAGGVYTFRFPARSPGEATVQIGEFAPGADDPDQTLDFNVTISDPAPLTGNTVTATADDSGQEITVAAGDWLDVTLESNPSTGYLWVVSANDGAVLRLLPESGFTASGELPGAGGVQRFAFRALQPGAVDFKMGLYPPGSEEAAEEFALTVTVE